MDKDTLELNLKITRLRFEEAKKRFEGAKHPQLKAHARKVLNVAYTQFSQASDTL